MHYLQDLIQKLTEYWASVGCATHFGYDLEMGAGTFNPTTFFRSIGPEPYKAAYLEPSRRPTDGRYGDNPNRMQHFLQFQVILKPSPKDIQKLYLGSLAALGFDIKKHDVRFVHDDWKSPTLGAWGLGWEVWVDGMEVSQFTYFQHFGGLNLEIIPGEITYGFERLAMYLQNCDNVYKLKWNKELTYGDIYHQSEKEWSTYNFDESNPMLWQTSFEAYEKEALTLIEKKLPIPAHDFGIKASHAFNMLEARGVISVSERTNYINRIRNISCQIANLYLSQREKSGFPLLKQKEKAIEKLPFKPAAFSSGKTDPFVLEIGVEELPQSFIPIGIFNLKKELIAFLDENNLSYSSVETYGSPRRLVAYIEDLAYGKKEEVIEKKGPPIAAAFDANGKPTKIGQGFLDSFNKPVLTLKQIHEKKDPHLWIEKLKEKDYLFIRYKKEAISTAEIFYDKIPKLILGLDFPKKMLWSDLKIAFPRPIQWLLALHGKKSVPMQIGPIISSDKSMGHPLLSDEKVIIKEASSYFSTLQKAFVIVDQNQREKEILTQIQKYEKKLQANVTHLQTVMKEVLFLTEYPVITEGSFDSKFLELPKELLELVLITHQRHFPLKDSRGKLLPQFLICLDTKSSPLIRKGHEKAVIPRLEDGLFLYHQDLKLGLDHFANKLKDISFQNNLGSLADKSQRLLIHAQSLNDYLNSPLSEKELKQSASLLKADLASNVVFEFPELQGIMGREYAKEESFSPGVCDAIYEHWLPRFEEDELPSTHLGILFSLADKIDNLLACFLTGKIPTSSSDPFALRRQALGIIRILIENKLSLPLRDIFISQANSFDIKVDPQKLNKLFSFFESRIKTVLTNYDLRPDEIQAILTLDHLDVYDLYLRAKSLHDFKNHELFKPLLEVYKRANGQLHTDILQEVDTTLFETKEEQELFNYFDDIKPGFESCLQEGLYQESFHLLATLQKPLADLFDKVKILTDDEKVRINRLALLSQIIKLFKKLFDFDLVLSS